MADLTVTVSSCAVRLSAVKPSQAAGSGWKVQYFEGASALTTSSSTITRSVSLKSGAHSIEAVWTKTGQPSITKGPLSFTLPVSFGATAPQPLPVPVPTPVPTPTPLPVPAGTLDPTKFTKLASIPVNFARWGNDMPYSQGLAQRYRNGQLSFFTMLPLRGEVAECAADGTFLRAWSGVVPPSGGYAISLTWDEAHQVLWVTAQVNYGESNAVSLCDLRGVSLNDDGTFTEVKRTVLQRTSDGELALGKLAFGGMEFLTTEQQTKFGLGPALVGWGGGTSLMSQRSKCALGLSVFSLQQHPWDAATPFDDSNIAGLTPEPGVTKKLVRADELASHVTTDSEDWYASGAPTAYDRGRRLSPILNYLDKGDPRDNPSTPPTDPPLSTANWISPAPDGFARCTWVDTYLGSGVLIGDSLLCVANLRKDRTWYQSGAVASDGLIYEWHVFALADLASVKAGTKSSWQVQPIAMIPFAVPDVPEPGGGTADVRGMVTGQTFDLLTRKLYQFIPATDGGVSPAGQPYPPIARIDVYQVP